MGILNEMFGDESSEQLPYEGELLAKGSYESSKETILAGYKIYQKKYVVKSLVLKMLIVLIAMASSIMMIMTSSDPVMPVFCLMLCVSIGIWFISQPISNKKKLSRGLDEISGISYEAEFYTDKVKISTVGDENSGKEVSEADIVLDGAEENSEEIPATVIHLDSPIVDILDKPDMFILIVNKSYVFIIPKTAFSEEDIQKIREKLSVIMGIRYKNVR